MGNLRVKKYWHKLSYAVQKDLLMNKGLNYILENCEQPEWCRLHNALDFWEGCWSLIDGFIKREEHCRDCIYYIRKSTQ